jgi:hypothetical protein
LAKICLAGHLQFPPAEVLDGIAEQHAISNSYPVEASGWDIAHIFFVEKSELEWKEESGKRLGRRVTCPTRNAALIPLTKALSANQTLFHSLLRF